MQWICLSLLLLALLLALLSAGVVVADFVVGSCVHCWASCCLLNCNLHWAMRVNEGVNWGGQLNVWDAGSATTGVNDRPYIFSLLYTCFMSVWTGLITHCTLMTSSFLCLSVSACCKEMRWFSRHPLSQSSTSIPKFAQGLFTYVTPNMVQTSLQFCHANWLRHLHHWCCSDPV